MVENNSNQLRATVLQTDIEWQSPQANLTRLDTLLHEAPASDLYLLPEMFATGFSLQPELPGVADAAEKTLEWMHCQACKLNAAIVGSMPINSNGHYYNRLSFVTPDKTDFYDKKHLFSYGGENQAYTPGCARVVVAFRGVRFLLQVCYDLRFPVFARNRNDYDAMLYVANWPTSRIAVWDALLRARALENQCYVLASNRIGTDPTCTYPGHSQVIDAYGRVEANGEEGAECYVSTTLDMKRLTTFRQQFPVLEDADDFFLADTQVRP